MRETLQEYGLFVLSPKRQEAIAAAWQQAGLTADDLRLLWRYIEDGESDERQARRYLAAMVADAARARESLDNLKRYRVTHPEDDKDYEYGSKERQGALERAREHDRIWEMEVAQRKLEGRWPPSTYRDPHPWENGVVKPPVFDTPGAQKKMDPIAVKTERLGHLVACATAYVDAKRPIPGHVVKEIIQLRSLWGGFKIPEIIRAAQQRMPKQ